MPSALNEKDCEVVENTMGDQASSPITTKSPDRFDIAIRRPTIAEIGSTEVPQAVVRMINVVYGEAEKGLWKTGFVRTNVTEVSKWIDDEELYLAFDTSTNHPSHLCIVGSVRVHEVERGIKSFGTLTVLPPYRSVGLGRRLVEFAESLARSRGSETMQLELAVPQPPDAHPQKEFLRKWYRKIGYEEARRSTVEETIPHLLESFTGPMEFCVMQKQLQ